MVKVTEVKKIYPKLGVSGPLLQFGSTDGYQKMHKAWAEKEQETYCFSM